MLHLLAAHLGRRSTERSARSGSEAVLWLAGVDWNAVRGTDRHLAERLAQRTAVVWVDPPLSVATVVRRRELRRLLRPTLVTRPAPGLHRISLLAPPFPERRGVARLTRALRRRRLARLVCEPPFERVRLTGVVGTAPYTSLDVLPRESTGPRLYLATDDFVAGADLLGHDASALEAAERSRLSEADVVAAVSQQILDRWGDRGTDAAIVPNGCDVALMGASDHAAPPDDVHLTGPVAGVVGQLSPRLDLGLLEAVVDAGISLLLVGPLVQDTGTDRFAALVARDRVCWVGPKPFEELPRYLRAIDVGLTPYVDNAFNRASFPLKTLEYLAAGLPVVSTPLPAVAALATDHIRTAAGPDAFARETLAAALASRDVSSVDARRAFAARHDWDHRVDALVELLGITSAAR